MSTQIPAPVCRRGVPLRDLAELPFVKLDERRVEGRPLYFAAEAALTPAHTGVPFITLDDGEPVYNDGTLDLVATICEAYKGIVKPSACTEHLKRKAYGAGAC